MKSFVVRFARDPLRLLGIVAMIGGAIGLKIVYAQAPAVCAGTPIVNGSPDIAVTCNTAGSWVISSISPYVKSAASTMPIDQTVLARIVWRTCSPADCPNGMQDPIISAAAMGDQKGFEICTSAAGDVITAATPILNGAMSIPIAPYQCAGFQSDGVSYLVMLTWQAGARQRCKSGQHMVSGSPFVCN